MRHCTCSLRCCQILGAGMKLSDRQEQKSWIAGVQLCQKGLPLLKLSLHHTDTTIKVILHGVHVGLLQVMRLPSMAQCNVQLSQGLQSLDNKEQRLQLQLQPQTISLIYQLWHRACQNPNKP